MRKGINSQEPNYFKIFDAVVHDSRLSFEEVDEISFNLVNAFSWVVPTEKALNKIAEYTQNGKIVELGAGRGYWAKLYSKQAEEVRCYDLYPQHNCHYPVEQAGPHKLREFGDDWTLLICSPQYRSDMVLEALRYFGGNRFIYLGDVDFSMNLPSIEFTLTTEWERQDEIDLPNWPGSDNKMILFNKRGTEL